MPRVQANESYVRVQLQRMRAREVQPDFWLDEAMSRETQASSGCQSKEPTDPVAVVATQASASTTGTTEKDEELSTRLAQHLLGLDLG